KEKKEQMDIGDTLLIPSNMLRSGEAVFLDDIHVDEAEAALQMKITAMECTGRDFIEAIISKEYAMERENDRVAYIRAFDSTGE
ncbi:MAG TPA: DUF512 domain-containing protein, partial [Lachnospiraceae bacterium]|nr:DUF512 domain-containing protein [Lachnospiraceae bacterium]